MLRSKFPQACTGRAFNPLLPDPNANGMLGAVEYMDSGTGRTGKRSPTSGYWKNFGPSLGSRKVVARGSYGISYTPETIGWAHYFIAGLTQTKTAAHRIFQQIRFQVASWGFSSLHPGNNDLLQTGAKLDRY